MSSQELGIIAKNGREIVRVSIDEYRGHRLLNLRVWFQAADRSWRPGKQGLALRLELLPELRAALDATAAAADPRWQNAGQGGSA